jgi:F-type H+-transporting ATPase subunit alpha
MGKGSMTGLPIIETKANDVSAFIPTNVISITDGQIFLQSDLFAANQRPAIDVGVSVSRVGGAAMTKAMKTVTGSLKVDLAQFRAMEAVAMFASDLDAASRQQLDRGQRLMELLKQPAYSPYPVPDMTVSLWLGTSGRLDRVPTDDVLRFEQEFLDFLRRSHKDVLETIADTMKFEDETEKSVASAYDDFLDQFETSEGGSIKAGHEEHEALEDEDIDQEQIVKQKKKG